METIVGEKLMNTTVNVDTPCSAIVTSLSPASVARQDHMLRLQLQAFLQFHPSSIRRMPTRAPSAPLRPVLIRGFKQQQPARDYAHRKLLLLPKGIEKPLPAQKVLPALPSVVASMFKM
jgi:hypothetical protein